MDPGNRTGDASAFGTTENPLSSESPLVWDRLIQATGPGSLIVVIRARMSRALQLRYTPEDMLQETLLHAWRDRSRMEWRGVASFRRWLISIAENRLRDLAEYEGAEKRGAGRAPVPFSGCGDSEGNQVWQNAGPAQNTTPSRVALAREQAEVMQLALDALPEEWREVVRLRLFEDLTLEEVAECLGIGVSGVRHRFRKGAAAYHRKLAGAMASRSSQTERGG